MDFGMFSVSLNVKDVVVSQDFYENLGFKAIEGGHLNADYPDKDGERWRIMEKGGVKVGLFEGMFDYNIMTFNPPDVRSIQKDLQSKGIKLTKEANLETSGADFITLVDPDGNQIMFDQW